MLTGKRVLIVEDEWLLADHIGAIVEHAGAMVIGPASSTPEALALLEHADAADIATLNIKLGDHLSFPVADRLGLLGIPYVFISANEGGTIPDRFHDRPLLAKPFTDRQVASALTALLD